MMVINYMILHNRQYILSYFRLKVIYVFKVLVPTFFGDRKLAKKKLLYLLQMSVILITGSITKNKNRN
jgi:hypothetical protein